MGGAPTTYSVNVGESYLTKVSGSVSNIHAISRGELIKVAGSIYRVCTDPNMEFTSSKIPLATAADASINTTFAGNRNYTTLPIYKPDTSLGCMTLNPAENTITTTWSDGVANDLRKDHNNKGISRGDLIRLGDPYTGDVFRVSTDLTRDFSSTKIPLGTVEDPSVAASFDPEEGRRLDGYPTDQLPIVNRPMYRLQTTSSIPFDATAVQMKNAVESMTLVGEVDVSRSINRNGYSWTTTHTSDRGARTSFLPNAFLTLSALEGPNVVVTGYVEETLSNLQPGVPYYARVTAYNAMGWGSPKRVFLHLLRHPISDHQLVALCDWKQSQTANCEFNGRHRNMMAVRQFPNTVLNGISMIISTAKLVQHAQGSAQVDAIDINGISEVQYVTTSATANDLGGTFTLTYHGQRTEQLPFDVSSEDMRNALMGLCTIDDVSISREIIGFGYTWMITFNSVLYAGDLDGELIADPLGLSGSDFNVTVQRDRAVVGRLPYHYIIKGLSNAMSYYVRLTAYNTLGTGIDITSEPALLKPAIQTPMIPQNVQATVRTSSSIVVSWEQPVSTGGNSIDYYRVEWDIVESFNSVCNGNCKVANLIPLGSSNADNGILNFTITDLTPGVRYFIRVLSKTNTGFSAPQNAMPYPLAPMAVPEVPSTVILSVDTTDSLLLEWQQAANTKKFKGFEWLPCNKISDSMGS